MSCNSLIKHDLARSGTTHLQQHSSRCKAKSKTAYQPSSSSSLHQHKLGSFFQPNSKIPAQLKEKVCDAALDFIVHDIRPLHAIEGKGLQSLVSACIEIGAKCSNVTVDTILPSRSTVKRKLDDKCKLVKANLAEVQKAIADYGLFGMTSDMWSDIKNRHYISITVHFVKEAQMFSRV